MVESDSGAAAFERTAQERPATASHVQQSVFRTKRKRGKYRLPQERMRVVSAVGIARAPPVRTPRNTVCESVDTPLPEPPDRAHG